MMKEIYIKRLRDYMESRRMPDYAKIKQVRLWNYDYQKDEIIHFKSRMGHFLYIVSTKEKESIQLAFSALSQYGFTDDLQYYPISIEFQNGDVIVTSDKTCETLWDLVSNKHFIVKIENDFVYAFDLQSSIWGSIPGRMFKEAYAKLLEYANHGKIIEASLFLRFKPKIRLVEVNPNCTNNATANTNSITTNNDEPMQNTFTLSGLFKKNPNIIINTDIDGFLSGMILQKYYGCKIVGFSNSRETIWVTPDVKSIYDPIYIDLYVNRPDVICIEQHIISYDKLHHKKIESMGTKINPNLERKRTFVGDYEGDYYHKYPFGTVHYLMALMAKEGIHVDFGNLNKEHGFALNRRLYFTNPGQVLLRADDALYSTLSPYRENALDWWNWLDPDKKSPAINSIRRFIDTCEIAKAKEYKKNIGDLFLAMGCDGIDGAFKTITDSQGTILEKVKQYNEYIGNLMGMSMDLPSKYIIHKGKYVVQYCRPGYDMNILSAANLYSYAFIFGPNPRYPNFSYTVDMED